MLDARLVTLQRKAVLAVLGSALVLIGVGQASAQADVAAVKGSAYGYQCVVSVFDQFTCSPTGPAPSVMPFSTPPPGSSITAPAAVKLAARPSHRFGLRCDTSASGAVPRAAWRLMGEHVCLMHLPEAR